ncbi:hypothetical protein [Streptomyces sp. NPDC020298]
MAVHIADVLLPDQSVTTRMLREYIEFLRVELGFPEGDTLAPDFAGPVEL